MQMERDHEDELKMLRARVAQLESMVSARPDPLLVSLMENHASFFSVVTPEGRLMATGRQSEVYGSVVGRSIHEFISPASQVVAAEALKRAARTKQLVNYEAEGYDENGEPGHFFHVRAVPLLDAETVHAIVLMPTDISERVHLERSLRESNDSLRLAVAATGMGFWRFDALKNVVTWDARMLELFGIDGPPPDYATYLTLLHPDDVALVQSSVEHALTHGVYPTIEHRFTRVSDGAERWMLGTATIERDAFGQVSAISGGALDITERKHLTRQIERAERVTAVGQLAAGIAHNFNNLLAIILPSLSLAVDSSQGRERDALGAALTATERARDLVKNMLSLTAVAPSPAHAASDLGEIARRTVEMCRANFPRQIELKLSLPETPLIVPLSVSDLEHLVLNLLTNAWDALASSSQGPAWIEVRVELVATKGENFGIGRLVVSDNGPGMSEGTRQRIFEPFFTTKAPNRGTGLGLAMVAARVHDAKGTIECFSRPGQGTSFSIELPLSQDVSPVDSVRPESTHSLLTGRVLVVDDEPLVRATLCRILNRAGLEVHEAENTAEARKKLKEFNFDLMILDDSMPVESGIKALESFRALTDAPVILFTGHTPVVPADVAATLLKPAHPWEILRVAEELLTTKNSTPLS